MRFLILKLGAFGDLTFALPMIRQIQNFDSGAEIEWIVDEIYAPFLYQFEGISMVHPVKSRLLFHGSFFSRIRFVFELRQKLGTYDAIFVLHRNTGFLATVIGKGPVFRLARKPLWGRSKLDIVVPPMTTQESLAYERVWLAFHQRQPIVRKVTGDTWFQATPLKSHGGTSLTEGLPQNCVAIHLGGGDNQKTQFNSKKWPQFPQLINRLVNETNHPILLLGTADELKQMGPLTNSERIISLCGRTNLSDLPSLAPHIACFVGPDSGPLHLFDLLKIPCIGLYGPTSEKSWGVLGQRSQFLIDPTCNCRPCYLDDGNFPPCLFNFECMKNISVDSVFARIQKLL